MSGERILVVEDEVIVARNLQDKLSAVGYDVPERASDGASALEKVDRLKPDLVLMDIRIKGDMDGVQTAEKIREARDIPVVYLTAYADDVTVQRAKITAPFAYILKPFQDRELYTAIEISLYRHAMEKALREAHDTLAFQVRELDARDRLVHLQMTTPTREGAWKELLNVIHRMVRIERAMLWWPDKGGQLKLVSELDRGSATLDEKPDAGQHADDPEDAMEEVTSSQSEPFPESLATRAFVDGSPQTDEATGHVAIPLLYGDRAIGVLAVSPGADGGECRGETLNAMWRVAQQGALLLRMATMSDDLEEGELKIDELLEMVSESGDELQ